MTTSNPKTAKANEARIYDLPKSDDFRELTPDEEKNVIGGAISGPPQCDDARVNSELENAC